MLVCGIVSGEATRLALEEEQTINPLFLWRADDQDSKAGTSIKELQMWSSWATLKWVFIDLGLFVLCVCNNKSVA